MFTRLNNFSPGLEPGRGSLQVFHIPKRTAARGRPVLPFAIVRPIAALAVVEMHDSPAYRGAHAGAGGSRAPTPPARNFASHGHASQPSQATSTESSTPSQAPP